MPLTVKTVTPTDDGAAILDRAAEIIEREPNLVLVGGELPARLRALAEYLRGYVTHTREGTDGQ